MSTPSYSHSPQPYYVTHVSSVIDYEDDYQGEKQGDAREDKLTTTMMLLAKAITQRYSTPTNNRLRTSSNIRNQAVIKDGRVDIQSKKLAMLGMVIGMQEGQTCLKKLMHEMVWFNKNMIQMFSGFQELSQLRERQTFCATTAMEKATM
ncbi:hypothetical protein Tco_1118990 [Tanacetum coccineum]